MSSDRSQSHLLRDIKTTDVLPYPPIPSSLPLTPRNRPRVYTPSSTPQTPKTPTGSVRTAPVLTSTEPTVLRITPTYMLAHRLLHEYKRAITDMRRNYAVCLFRSITRSPSTPSSDEGILGHYITLIPPQPNAPRTTVTLEIQEVDVQDDEVGRTLRRLSEAGGERHAAQHELMDLSADGLSMPVLPRGFSGWSVTDGVRGL
jgi:hypothetical protein